MCLCVMVVLLHLLVLYAMHKVVLISEIISVPSTCMCACTGLLCSRVYCETCKGYWLVYTCGLGYCSYSEGAQVNAESIYSIAV